MLQICFSHHTTFLAKTQGFSKTNRKVWRFIHQTFRIICYTVSSIHSYHTMPPFTR